MLLVYKTRIKNLWLSLFPWSHLVFVKALIKCCFNSWVISLSCEIYLTVPSPLTRFYWKYSHQHSPSMAKSRFPSCWPMRWCWFLWEAHCESKQSASVSVNNGGSKVTLVEQEMGRQDSWVLVLVPPLTHSVILAKSLNLCVSVSPTYCRTGVIKPGHFSSWLFWSRVWIQAHF